MSVAVYASVYACVSLCAQTDRPTDCGNATSWGCPSTIPLIMNDPCPNSWLPCPTQWWHHTSSDWLKMIPIQRSVFDVGDAGLFIRCVRAELNRQVIVLCHIWTESSAQVDRCEPVWVRHYTHGFSVDMKRNDNGSCRRRRVMMVMVALGAHRHTIGRCHVALHGRPPSIFDCQRCKYAVQ